MYVCLTSRIADEDNMKTQMDSVLVFLTKSYRLGMITPSPCDCSLPF